MSFNSKYSKYLQLVREQPEDATAPDPNAGDVQVDAVEKPVLAKIAPEGYVNIVKMVAKALAMTIEPSEIDTLLTGEEITKENALQIEKGLAAVMRDNEVKHDNIERLNNPNLKNYIDSINEKTFMQRYNHLLSLMKRESPYIS